MINDVHLLCTSCSASDVSFMRQRLGRQYVRYFNYSYKQTGTLWEGRYKSCIVQEEHYLLQLYCYIEMNPVRANMVIDPSEYAWASYQINALGKMSKLCIPHELYSGIGNNKLERESNYPDLYKHHVDVKLLTDIRLTSSRGLALGSDKSIKEIEQLIGRRMTLKKRGRH